MFIVYAYFLSRHRSGRGGGLTSRLGLWLGGGAAGSIPRSAFVFCGGENICVHCLCMGVGVRTALLAFTQLSSITEWFKLCWRTGQKAHLETILLFENLFINLCAVIKFLTSLSYIVVVFFFLEK